MDSRLRKPPGRHPCRRTRPVFIPEGARWYLGEVVLEHVIEGDPRNVVHVNAHLIEAGSPEEAYRKALALGREGRSTYLNMHGKRVRVRFLGLRALNVIHDDLEDGVELCCTETIALSKAKLRYWITPKRMLGAFAPIPTRLNRPNYMPESIMKLLEERGVSRAEADALASPPGASRGRRILSERGRPPGGGRA